MTCQLAGHDQAVAPVTRILCAIDGKPAAFDEWVQVGGSTGNEHGDPSPFLEAED